MENTYLLWGDSKQCTIIDPGMLEQDERDELRSFLDDNGLTLSQLVNTHCHVDHIFGNDHIASHYGLELHAHELELPNIERGAQWAQMYGINMDPSPMPKHMLVDGQQIEMGDEQFDVLFVPGHSPGHVAFYNQANQVCIAGDVLFRESIGRYDLPGGDYNTLEASIQNVMYKLEDDTEVLPGHGPNTTIGHEKKFNPFVKG